MQSFFGCLLVLLFGIVIAVFVIIGNLIDVILSFLGFKKRVTNNATRNGGYSNQQSAYGNGNAYNQGGQQHGPDHGQQRTARHQNGKIFEKDDSEYVDFEEV